MGRVCVLHAFCVSVASIRGVSVVCSVYVWRMCVQCGYVWCICMVCVYLCGVCVCVVHVCAVCIRVVHVCGMCGACVVYVGYVYMHV